MYEVDVSCNVACSSAQGPLAIKMAVDALHIFIQGLSAVGFFCGKE